jgi:hypothetical protein
MKIYELLADSLNGKRGYAAKIEANTEREAEELFLDVITDHCREEFESAPVGIPYLADTRTIIVREILLTVEEI